MRHGWASSLIPTGVGPISGIASTCGIGGFSFTRYNAEFKSLTVSEVEALAAVIGFSSAPALLFEDQAAAQQSLSALGAKKNIAAAFIYDQKGALFSSLNPRNLRAEFPAVRVTASDENLGFTRGNNVALRQCAGRYALLQNALLLNVKLCGASLVDSYFRGADLKRANLAGSILSRVNFQDTIMPDGTVRN